MKFLDAVLFALTLSFTVPPCFAAPPSHVVFAPRPIHIVLCLLAAAILVRYGKKARSKSNAATRAVTMGAALVTFGVLCVSSAIMSALSGGKIESAISSPKQVPLCAITFLLSAFYEETVYRFYLPHVFSFVFKKLPHGTVIAEVLAVLLFAFAHKYSGVSSVVNALLAATALRLCLIRGQRLAAAVGVHTAYNVLQLMLLMAAVKG